MTEQSDRPDQIRYARRFTATIPGQPDIHGVQFPSGRITAFLNADVITDDYDGAVIHWADQEQP